MINNNTFLGVIPDIDDQEELNKNYKYYGINIIFMSGFPKYFTDEDFREQIFNLFCQPNIKQIYLEPCEEPDHKIHTVAKIPWKDLAKQAFIETHEPYVGKQMVNLHSKRGIEFVGCLKPIQIRLYHGYYGEVEKMGAMIYKDIQKYNPLAWYKKIPKPILVEGFLFNEIVNLEKSLKEAFKLGSQEIKDIQLLKEQSVPIIKALVWFRTEVHMLKILERFREKSFKFGKYIIPLTFSEIDTSNATSAIQLKGVLKHFATNEIKVAFSIFGKIEKCYVHEQQMNSTNQKDVVIEFALIQSATDAFIYSYFNKNCQKLFSVKYFMKVYFYSQHRNLRGNKARSFSQETKQNKYRIDKLGLGQKSSSDRKPGMIEFSKFQDITDKFKQNQLNLNRRQNFWNNSYLKSKHQKNSPKKEEVKEEEEIHNCCVCLTQMSEGDEIETLPCNHIIHKLCINEWKKQSNLCPMCRARI